MRAPSLIHDHHNITGHELSLENFSIVGREDQSIARAIKETILIKVNYQSLNRNKGKYHLPHIWDEVLVKSPELKTQITVHNTRAMVTPLTPTWFYNNIINHNDNNK